jgi:hypothetical protein
MSGSPVHPRRSPQKAPLALKKGSTFNGRRVLASDIANPFELAHHSPRRSPTSLGDLVARDEQPDRQALVADFLKDMDNVMEGRAPTNPHALTEDQVLAVPHILVNHAVVPNYVHAAAKKDDEHHHYSDSGLGTSVASTRQGTQQSAPGPSFSNPSKEDQASDSTRNTAASIITGQSAITRSFSSDSYNSQYTGPKLTKDGLHHIQDKILKPILQQSSLKEFHPLVQSIPQQVDRRFISNLRDLEKTFLYSAPVSLKTYLSACAVAYYHGRDMKRFSLSANSFSKFWEFSIQCLHTTVEYLAERDQRRPSDRPYTNNYFLDLVEQIRRYADIMARSREKEANGEPLDDMDYSPYVSPVVSAEEHSPNPMTHVSGSSHLRPLLLKAIDADMSMVDFLKSIHSHPTSDESLAIQGGLSTNGRPAEIVRKKDGKTIPLINGSYRTAMDAMSSKRPHSDDEFEDDDDPLRSMARRRKSDRAGDVMHQCSSCSKEFKRPCDLTKHEKTHSRPFKCSERSCRYHDLGWPTEKERDRHINDKHSAAPRMYRCKFAPCSYASKRESNCKQHMEKTHNWVYVRSKSNGRKKSDTASVTSAAQSPPSLNSPAASTPTSAPFSVNTPDSTMSHSPWMPTDENYDFGTAPNLSVVTKSFADAERRDSTNTGFSYSPGFEPGQLQVPVDALASASSISLFDEPPNFNFDLDNLVQQPTPELSPQQHDFDTSMLQAGPDLFANQSLDSMLLYKQPEMTDYIHDEGLGEMINLDQDFTLFGTDGMDYQSTSNPVAMNWYPPPTNDMDGSGFDGGLF